MSFKKINSTIRFGLLIVTLLLPAAKAGFSSIYAFGDGICSTDDNDTTLTQLYEGKRYCNGRVWIEVLAQWQGITYEVSKNKSYYGHDSVALLTSVNQFAVPPDAATALFVVWVNNADFVEYVNSIGNEPPYTTNTPLAPWTTFINQATARHTQAVTTLYNKGARTIIMPKAVNIGATPIYNLDSATNTFLKQRALEFNTAFDTAMIAVAAANAGLVIYRPDTYTFLEQTLANPGAFGLVHPPNTNGAVFDYVNPSKVTGIATNYIFWDDLNPTAKFQMYLADLAQQMISPAKVSSITLPGSNAQITVANVPLGRPGVVEGSSALVPPWQTDASISVPFTAGGSTTSSVTFPAVGTKRFYRVGFPAVWVHP